MADKHTRSSLAYPAEHPGKWVTRTEHLAGCRVSWKLTRCSRKARVKCKCGGDDPSDWHGPFAYAHLPGADGRGSKQYYCGAAVDEQFIAAVRDVAWDGGDVKSAIRHQRDVLSTAAADIEAVQDTDTEIDWRPDDVSVPEDHYSI